MTNRQTRAERAAAPLARDSIRKLAESYGGCLRPVQLRRTDTQTGEAVSVVVPCGATLSGICPPCAERAKALRAAQCREGWHLEDEPDLTPAAPDDMQEFWLTLRAEAQLRRDQAGAAGQDTTDYDELIDELDAEITRAGVRGTVTTNHASDGKVNDDGTPADPGRYDYARAARDALHFAALFDRFIRNLRQVLGYDAQYFGGVEPQKRLAPHIHLAVRGSVPRPLLRQVLAATYHQVWWPATDEVRFAGDQLPVWDEDPATTSIPRPGKVLQTWDDALDAIGPEDEPRHVARFGPKFDAQGVLAGSKDANKGIGYLTKYLTKQVADCHAPETDPQRTHADRLAEALRCEPCSPTCANWLRYGIQPKNARPGLVPGACKGKARRPEHCGYAGRRVLVSRKWSGKSLADHRPDRKAWLVETLGLEVPDPTRYTWNVVTPSDYDYLAPDKRLLHVVADRRRWKQALDEARRRARDQEANLPATGRRHEPTGS